MTRQEELSHEALITGEARCAKCVYYESDGETCRFNPPEQFVIDGEMDSYFPVVGELKWCGKFLYDETHDG